MPVGLLEIDCFIAESTSLKDKRRVLSSLFERLRRQFNVALCEVDFQDQWQRSLVAVVFVNTEWRMVQSAMSKLLEYVERDHRLNVLGSESQQLD
ncbi:MAG: DUF503 domain-containing protein [bacterium]